MLEHITGAEVNHQLQTLGNVRSIDIFAHACCSAQMHSRSLADAPTASLNGERRRQVTSLVNSSTHVQVSDRDDMLLRSFLSPAHRQAASMVRCVPVTYSCALPYPPAALRQHRVQTLCMLSPSQRSMPDKQQHCACTTNKGLKVRMCAQIETWMAQAGLTAWTDAIGNVHGELRSSNASAASVVLGSHYDTVLDAGKFDGALGVITSIAAVKALSLGHLHDASWDVAAGACHWRWQHFVVVAPCALSVCEFWTSSYVHLSRRKGPTRCRNRLNSKRIAASA